MVSRKRSKGSKKGWQTRRFKALDGAISRRSFDVWDQFTTDAQRKVLQFRRSALNGAEDRDVISAKIERMGNKISFFFHVMETEFGLEKHEIKSILFSPIPMKGKGRT